MELLIVVIIITLVMSIAANTYRDQRKHVRYNDAILKVNELIKTARNYAVTSRSVHDPCEVGNEDYVPEEGYGVYISRSDAPDSFRVVLFANTEKDDEVEINQFDNLGVSCANDLILEDITISGDDANLAELSIDKNHTSIGGGTDDEAVILFRPPLAEAGIFVNDHPAIGSLTALNDLYLRFRRPNVSSASSRYIHFNRIAGFPEIETE